MITERMTLDELYKELEADKKEVKDKIFTPYRINALKRLSMKNKDKDAFLSFFVNTSRRNRYACIIGVHSWREFCEYQIHQYIIAIYDTSHGKYAATSGKTVWTTNEHHLVTRYQPHFFSRYAERMGIKLTGEELILRFFSKNNLNSIKTNPLGRDPYEVFSATAEGLSLGFIDKRMDIKYNTFIPFHDLGKAKYEISQEELPLLNDLMTAKYGSFIKSEKEMPFFTYQDMMQGLIEQSIRKDEGLPSERHKLTYLKGEHQNALFEFAMREMDRKSNETNTKEE